MTADYGPVAIAGVLVAFFIGLNDYYDRSSDNLHNRKHDCLVSLLSTYDVLIRRGRIATDSRARSDPSIYDKAIESEIDLNGKWAAVEAVCVMPEILTRDDNQVGNYLDSAKHASLVPITEAAADQSIAKSVNWVRFAIKEIYGLKITQGWIVVCNPAFCRHSYPKQKYTFGDLYSG